MPQNSTEYVNPIISSIVESSRQRMDKARLAQQAEQFKAEQALRQQHQDALEKQIEKEHEIELQKLENDRKFREAQVEQSKIGALGSLAQIAQIPGVDLSGFINRGVNTQPGIVGAEQPETLSVPGTSISFPNFLPSPSAVGQAQVQRAKEMAGAKAEGALPSQLTLLGEKHKQASELKQMELAAHLQNTVLQGKNQIEAAKIHSGYAQAVANINGAYHLKGIAMMNALGFGEDQAEGGKQLMDGVFDGTIDPSKLTMPRKKLLESYASGTGELASLPLDFKNYKTKLDNMSSLQNLVQEYRTIANNYSYDSPGSGQGGNKYIDLGGTIGRHGFIAPGSELASKLASVKSEGGTIAAFFDKMNGRRSEAEILRETSGWFNPAFTKDQNLAMIDEHVKRLQNEVRGLFTGMSPDRVNKVLGDRQITDFGAFKSAAAVSKLNEGQEEGKRYQLPNGKTVVYKQGKYWEE